MVPGFWGINWPDEPWPKLLDAVFDKGAVVLAGWVSTGVPNDKLFTRLSRFFICSSSGLIKLLNVSVIIFCRFIIFLLDCALTSISEIQHSDALHVSLRHTNDSGLSFIVVPAGQSSDENRSQVYIGFGGGVK